MQHYSCNAMRLTLETVGIQADRVQVAYSLSDSAYGVIFAGCDYLPSPLEKPTGAVSALHCLELLTFEAETLAFDGKPEKEYSSNQSAFLKARYNELQYWQLLLTDEDEE